MNAAHPEQEIFAAALAWYERLLGSPFDERLHSLMS